MPYLTRYNRRSPLYEMSRALDRMQNWVDRSWPFTDDELPFDGKGNHLAIDMHSDDNYVTLNAALPGFKEDDIHIDVQGDILTISAEKRAEHEKKDEDQNWHYQEMSWGKTTRRVQLPQQVNMDKAEATLQDGILTVKLPVVEDHPARKISIKPQKLLTK